MGFGGGGSGSFVLPNHTHSSVLEDGGELEKLITKVDTEILKDFPKMEFLDSNKLSADGNGYTFTPTSSLNMSTDYSAIIIYMDGASRIANDIGIKINGISDYDYNQVIVDVGVLSGTNISADTKFETIPSTIMNNDDYISSISTITFGDNSGNNARPYIESTGMSVYEGSCYSKGVCPVTVGDYEIDSIQIISANATGFRVNTEFIFYGVRR